MPYPVGAFGIPPGYCLGQDAQLHLYDCTHLELCDCQAEVKQTPCRFGGCVPQAHIGTEKQEIAHVTIVCNGRKGMS